MELSFDEVCAQLGIPDVIRRSYENRGLRKLHSWQYECLCHTGALLGKNLVYCAPTGGGKTLVAELVILKTVIVTRKKSILILPYVSLVLEKEKEFRRLVNIYNRSKSKSDRIRVRGFHGDKKSSKFVSEDILICTIEKANVVVNSLIARGLAGQIRCVVVDEMHVLGDSQRGYHLEILISKLKYLQNKGRKYVGSEAFAFQMVALSATMPNIADLAKWFGAALYVTTFRPVPLKEMIKAGNEIVDTAGTHIRYIHIPGESTSMDPETQYMISLCKEGLSQGQQVVIFCSSRNQCESTVRVLLQIYQKEQVATRHEGCVLTLDELEIARGSAVEKISSHNQACGFSVSPSQETLLAALRHGVAFHHAGLSEQEREVVEGSFRRGVVSVLVATSTLAAGVNLPAGRVLIRSMRIGRDTLGPTQYRQMCGRAGRPGLTSYGESFLLVKRNEKHLAMQLTTAPLPLIRSQIHPTQDGGKALLKVLLDLFALGLCNTVADVLEYVEHTMAYAECSMYQKEKAASDHDAHNVTDLMTNTVTLVKFLSSANAIHLFPVLSSSTPSVMSPSSCYASDGLVHDYSMVGIKISRFGRAVVESTLNPDEAIVLYEDLMRAREGGINLETNLYLLYLVTPLAHNLSPDFKKLWGIYEKCIRKPGDPMAATFKSVGIDEGKLFRWTHQPPRYDDLSNCGDRLRLFKIRVALQNSGSDPQRQQARLSSDECTALCRCKRLWAASALNMLLDCQSVAQVASTYMVSPQDITNLRMNAEFLSSRLAKFSREIGWMSVERLMKHINTCIACDNIHSAECRELMSIPGMNLKLAKTLLDSGFQSVERVATAPTNDIVQALLLARQFEVMDLHQFEQATAAADNECEDTNENSGNDAVSSGDDAVYRQLKRMVGSLVLAARQRWEELVAESEAQAIELMASDISTNGVLKSDEERGVGLEQDCMTESDDDSLSSDDDEGMAGYMHQQPAWLTDAKSAVCGTSTQDATLLQSESSGGMELYDDDKSCVAAVIQLSQANGVDSMYAPSPSTHTTGSDDKEDQIEENSIPDEAFVMLFEQMEKQSVFQHPKAHSSSADMAISMNGEGGFSEYVSSSALRSIPSTPSVCLRSSDSMQSLRKSVQPSEIAPHITLKSQVTPQLSPYLLPYTPSKRSTPGQYLYLPQIEGSGQRRSRAADIVASQPDQLRRAFGWKHIGEGSNCESFLSSLKSCKCVAFEVVYSTIPFSSTTGDGVPSYVVTKAWAPLTAWAPTSSLMDTTRKTKSTEPIILTGISFCFGDAYGYYVPLPTIPPILIATVEKQSPMLSQRFARCNPRGLSDRLPDKAKLLICRYVGFDKIFNKCPRLKLAVTGKHTPRQVENNPLMCASREWAEVSRRALRHEWQRGCCVEWRLCNEIMNSDHICKISVDMKSKMMTLRERDILMNGHLEDPQVALSLLESNSSVKLDMPVVRSAPNGLPEKFVSIIRSCYAAVASFRVMGDLEQILTEKGLWSTFANIEMPLCYTVCDAELNGMPIDTSFFTNLRQDLNDRIKVIEYYFKTWKGPSFNLASPQDVSLLKSDIRNIISSNARHVGKALAANLTTQSCSFPPDWNCNTSVGIDRTQWSAGKENEPAPQSYLEEKQQKTRELEAKVHRHPVMLLVREWRSHTRFLPTLSAILGARFRLYGQGNDRVRGNYRAIGTDTGRLIIATPPLQQVPHDCTYVAPVRPTLHDEMLQAASVSPSSLHNMIQQVNSNASSGNLEWVRLASMRSIPPPHTNCSSLEELNLSVNGMYCGTGVSLSKVPVGTNGKLVSILESRIDEPIQCNDGSNIVLVDMWREFGHVYSDKRARSVRVVAVSISGRIRYYPSDKVCRLLAPLIPSEIEVSNISSGGVEEGESNVVCVGTSDAFTSVNPRMGFQTSGKYILLASDYSQIELRILAHFAGDRKLCGAFAQNEDIFKSIASQWKRKPLDRISKDERNRVKQLCYALLYGAGPAKVADDAQCTVKEAETLIQDFLGCYPGIKSFMEEVKRACRSKGYVETMLGRVRHLPAIRSESRKERSRAERQAINTVCQGSAADLVKLAMINIHHRLQNEFQKRNYHSRRSYPGGGLYAVLDSVRLVLQVHDELVYEVPEEYLYDVAEIVRDCMEGAVDLNVPLRVKLSAGSTWGDLKPLEISRPEGIVECPSPCNVESSVRQSEVIRPCTDVNSVNTISKPVARCIFRDT